MHRFRNLAAVTVRAGPLSQGVVVPRSGSVGRLRRPASRFRTPTQFADSRGPCPTNQRSAPERNRTAGLPLRRRSLYPTELPGQRREGTAKGYPSSSTADPVAALQVVLPDI